MDFKCCLVGHNETVQWTPSQCCTPLVEDLGEGWQKPSNSEDNSAIPSVDSNVPYPLLAKVQVGTSFGLSCNIVSEMFVSFFTNV
jgi:hypothetical protein